MKRLLFITAILLGLLPASIATAHDPIILTSDQHTPINGPLLIDGTISFALYGSLDASGDTRGFRVQFKEGDPLSISILIPDLSPENLLSEDSLPIVNVEDPDGVIVKLAVTEKVSFPAIHRNQLCSPDRIAGHCHCWHLFSHRHRRFSSTVYGLSWRKGNVWQSCRKHSKS